MDVAARVDEIDRELRDRGTSERATKERAYLKSDLEHYGTTVPEIRAVVKLAFPARPVRPREEVVALAESLWTVPVHERRAAAVEVLTLHRAALGADDLPVVERLLREARTWALVDGLAATVVGAIMDADPSAATTLDRWATDDDFWIRRAALLALLGPLRRGEGDFDRFSRYADAMLEEKEFFIRKAIGWVLRETAKRRPDLVYDWLLPRARWASGVTIREAVKPLSDTQRDEVLASR